MTKEEKIFTLHPQGKKGVQILKQRYDVIYNYIADKLRREKEMFYRELSDQAVRKLANSFDGKVAWYIVTVKLDMEARGIIKRVPGSNPHKIRLKEKDRK